MTSSRCWHIIRPSVEIITDVFPSQIIVYNKSVKDDPYTRNYRNYSVNCFLLCRPYTVYITAVIIAGNEDVTMAWRARASRDS